MAIGSIPISGLNVDGLLQSQDFFPVVDSASLTTYRTPIQSIGNWMLASGSSSSSLFSISTSWAPVPLSASWASSSISSSYSITSSYSLQGPFTTLFTGSTYQITSSWANNSLSSISSSWSSQSLSSSYAITSSYSLSSSYAVSASVSTTSSYAFQAAMSQPSITFFPTTTLIDSGTSAQSNTQYLGNLIPSSAYGVILQASVSTSTTGTAGYIYISTNLLGSDQRILIGYRAAGGGDAPTFAGQGFFPVIRGTSSGSFFYQITQPLGSWSLWIIGYY